MVTAFLSVLIVIAALNFAATVALFVYVATRNPVGPVSSKKQQSDQTVKPAAAVYLTDEHEQKIADRIALNGRPEDEGVW